MKLVKAYIRTYFVYDVVHALESIGVPRVSVFNIAELGKDIDKEDKNISSEFGIYEPMAKLELIVWDSKVDAAVDTILGKARTGRQGEKGDGIIAISPVDEVISVRTGEKGAGILEE